MAYDLSRRAVVLAAAQTAVLAGMPLALFAQSGAKWPVDTLKLIAPVPAGGGVDVFCRKVADRLAFHLGMNVVVDNRAGAAGFVGAKALSAAAPDGSAIGFLHSGLVSVQAMGGKLDLAAEFRPIVGRFSESQFIIAVNADAKYKTLSDLFREISAQPGKLNYGTGGQGTPGHMIFELIRQRQPSLQAQDVPFKGAIEGVNALLAKDIDFVVGVMSTVLVQVKSGRLRALAVTGATRSAQLPDVPTVSEAALPGFSYVSWSGFFGPAKLPDRLTLQLQEALARIAQEPEFLQFVAVNGGQVPATESVSQFQAFLRDSIAKETAVMAKLGLKAG